MNEEVMPYRKKAKKKTPKKSDHKHWFKTCVVEYVGKEFKKERGFVEVASAAIRDYCPVCGKVQYPEPERWWTDLKYGSLGWYREETKEYLKELNPETRTLPTFHIDYDIFDLKFVDLSEVNSDESK